VSTPTANLLVELYDGSSVINDDTGNANQISVAMSGESTTYANHTAVFRLPDPLPNVIKMRIRCDAALGSGNEVLVDDVIMTDMVQLYTAGPYFACIRGATDFGLDDFWTATITNDRAGTFQTLFDRFYNLPEKLLPSGAATISAALIG